ncbi:MULTISPECIES: zinc metalloprotease HtpX [unclassified Paenibacillus]|uniref:zinc metalloprotease HtpX n=1 Tax=unclassified Paenibacillus TaxID=185978 RepID=UPI001AE80405|nr:heat shock protein HtpX [Paenibacillus sp. PvP091]MBP1171880.1 heat shock protein HtpX [Paenibacillus sp. PvR098]MBP2438261.1 heat shock protein HtpX [Paenibacillus sp. PvP052]
MLYQQIEQNKRKTILLVLLFSILVIGAGCAVGYLGYENIWLGLGWAAAVLVFYVPITYMSANSQVLRVSGARPATREEHPQLYHIIEELCIPARIPMPKIYIVEDPSPNAFATGIKPEKGAVAFTTGLLERLNREELEAVAAHEIAHIRNYDIRLMTISIALISVIAILADMGTRMLFHQRRGNSNKKTHPAVYVIALAFIILSPIAARFVHFAVSRNREYLADATAIEMTRNATGLKNALIKISGSDLNVLRANKTTASMYISNPFSKERKKQGTSWFSTHPSMASRIERLERM